MKLLYLTNNRFPTEKAHGLQVAKMCEAFLAAGTELLLVVPRRKQTKHVRTNSARDFYSLDREIPVKGLWCVDFLSSRWFPRLPAYILQSLSFAWRLRQVIKRYPEHVIYSRTLLPLKKLKGRKWFFEAHTFPKTKRGRKFQRKVLARSAGVICISEGLKEKYEALLPKSVPILVAHDGVDLDLFDSLPAKKTARERLGLPLDKKLIVYTGSPYKWKGVWTLADASRHLDEASVVFVGGNENEPEFQALKDHAWHARVLPYVPYSMVPEYLAAADVLVIPNSSKDPISRVDTSPLKLFEYMASGRKIVASDVPALKAVLNDKTAWFFEADKEEDLKRVLLEVIKSTNKKGENAKKAAKKYSWDERVEKILEFLKIM